MFCTGCGAQIFDGEKFCSKCGRPVKAAEEKPPKKDNSYDRFEPIVVNITPDMMQSGSSAPSGETKPLKKKSKLKVVIISLLIVLVLLVGVGVISNMLDATTPQEIINALIKENEGESSEGGVSSSDEALPEDEAQITAEEEITTTTTSTTTSTTTTTTTVSTTSKEQLLAQQSKEIQKLLVSKKWTTELEGYQADITFKNDGTALVEVDLKIGFISMKQKVDATYEISPRCFAIIRGSYNGMNLGISGTITKISDKELLLDRGGDLGTLTLKAK